MVNKNVRYTQYLFKNVVHSCQDTGPVGVSLRIEVSRARVRVCLSAPYCLRVVSKSLKSNDDEACKLGVNRPHSLYKLLHIVIK